MHLVDFLIHFGSEHPWVDAKANVFFLDVIANVAKYNNVHTKIQDAMAKKRLFT